jgi:hypothetical protein
MFLNAGILIVGCLDEGEALDENGGMEDVEFLLSFPPRKLDGSDSLTFFYET